MLQCGLWLQRGAHLKQAGFGPHTYYTECGKKRYIITVASITVDQINADIWIQPFSVKYEVHTLMAHSMNR